MDKWETYKSTIKEVSKDDNNIPLVADDMEVYWFDGIKEELCNEYRHKKHLSSVDALKVNSKGEIFFIEFKNARKSNYPKNVLFSKAFDSIYIAQLYFFSDKTLRELCDCSYFIAVYNDDCIPEEKRENESVSFVKIKDKINQWTNVSEEFKVLWGMEKYRGVFYKEVYTIDKNTFVSEFLLDVLH